MDVHIRQGDSVSRELGILLKSQSMFLLVLMPGTCCPGLRVSWVAGGASPVIFARAPVLGRCGDFMVNNRIESLLAGLKTSPYQEAVLFGLQSNQQLLCTLYLLFCTFICTLYIVPVKIISSLPLSSGGDSLPPAEPGKGDCCGYRTDISSQTLQAGIKRSQGYAEPLPN